MDYRALNYLMMEMKYILNSLLRLISTYRQGPRNVFINKTGKSPTYIFRKYEAEASRESREPWSPHHR